MGQLNPHLRDIPDYKHKLWDHLFIMSRFELEIESPFEKALSKKTCGKSLTILNIQNQISLSPIMANILKQ